MAMNPIPPNQHTDGVDDRTAQAIRSGMDHGVPMIRTIDSTPVTAWRQDTFDVTASLPIRTWPVHRARTHAVPFIGDARHEVAVREWKVATNGTDQVGGDSTLHIVDLVTREDLAERRHRHLLRYGRVPSWAELLDW